MTTEISPSSPTGLQGRIDYGKLTLLQLTERIADSGDPGALKELHDHRAIFGGQREDAIHLAEYIAGLTDSRMPNCWCGGDDSVLAEAYNLTVDKFYNIPSEPANLQQQRPSGSDCRYYYKAFIRCAKSKLKAEPLHSAIESEMVLTQTLLKLIKRHFFLSCLEAKRRAQKLKRRYIWKIGGKIIYLWLPWELAGQRCREWLQANVPDADPQRPGEQDRVQAIVDRLLTKRNIFYLSELNRVGERLPPSPGNMPPAMQDQISVKGLAEAVAIDKTENIKQQRRTIQRLGRVKLAQLIRTVFTSLAHGDYLEKDVASRFGLSPATLSRFAGSRFRSILEDVIVTNVPDLWRNTAGVLSSHPDFVIAAQKSGVWKRIRKMADAKDAREDS